MRDIWVTWVKIKGRPKCSSPFELIQNSKSKANANESPEKERRQIQAVTLTKYVLTSSILPILVAINGYVLYGRCIKHVLVNMPNTF